MINLGNKIRELRKKKGLTQEQLADALAITPQAVSKWEMGDTYPDMALIPTLAGFFEVSLDILFGFDLDELNNKVDAIIRDGRSYYFDDPKRYAQTMTAALIDYPGNEKLLHSLLNSYEYDLRSNDCTDHLDDMIRIADKLIPESHDFSIVCDAKEAKAAALLAKGEYNKAKEVLETLPYEIMNDVMAFRLKGKDKLNAAAMSRCHHLQQLYIACDMEGDAWFRMDEHPEATFRDYTPADYIPEALRYYRRGLAVLETFLLRDFGCEGEDLYLWPGMQTFHYSFWQKIAACHKRLGQTEECKAAVEESYRIISTAWRDFDENPDYYMENYNKYLRELDLAEYVK